MGDISAHFSRSEFACKCGCGFDTVDTELLTMLEVIRQKWNLPVSVESGCRCWDYHAHIYERDGLGTPPKNSQHLFGRAADIKVSGISPAEVQAYVIQLWPDKYGIGSYNSFTHVDSRGVKSRW